MCNWVAIKGCSDGINNVLNWRVEDKFWCVQVNLEE